MYSALKRLVVGPPLASSDEHHTRIGKPTGLAVLASDAISSTAYATEELLLVLMPVAGMAALADLVPISIVVAVLLVLWEASSRLGLLRPVLFSSPSVIAATLVTSIASGEMGRHLGATLIRTAGGLVLGLAEAMTAGYISSSYKDAVPFVLILLVLFFLPRGMFGSRAADRV